MNNMPSIKEIRLNALIDRYGNKALLEAKIEDFVLREGESENGVTYNSETLAALLRFYELICLAVLAGYASPTLSKELTKQLFDLHHNTTIEEQYIKDGKNDLVHLLIRLNMNGSELNTDARGHALLFEDVLILKRQWEEEGDAIANFVQYLSYGDGHLQNKEMEMFKADLYDAKAYEECYWQGENNFQSTLVSFLTIQDLVNGLADILSRTESELLRSSFHTYFHQEIQTLAGFSEMIKKYFEACSLIPLFYQGMEQEKEAADIFRTWQWQSMQVMLQSMNNYHLVTNFSQFDVLRNLLKAIDNNDFSDNRLTLSIVDIHQSTKNDIRDNYFRRNDLERGMEGYVEV